MNALVCSSLKQDYCLNLDEVFETMQGKQMRYNWLISDYDCNIYPSELILRGERSVWMSGEDLTALVKKHDIQFIWGVFTAFEQTVSLHDIQKYPLPYADGNPIFWCANRNIQHPLGSIEIVSWDSALLVMITELKEVVQDFTTTYACEELNTYRIQKQG